MNNTKQYFYKITKEYFLGASKNEYKINFKTKINQTELCNIKKRKKLLYYDLC